MNPIFVSTRLWDFARPEPLPGGPPAALPWTAAPFAKLVADLPAEGVTCDARIPERRFEEVVSAVRGHGLQIAALESLCPHPAELSRHEPRPDLVPLSNPDESERDIAIRLHRKTIERAADLQAPVIVLTVGRVIFSAPLAEPEGERETRAYLARRAEEAPRFLDAARFAIDKLMPAAERHGRKIAIAISSELAAIPSFQELSGILGDFRGAPLGAWLDTAAMWRLERQGVRRVATWSELRDSTFGVRLRDVRDADEAVPGEGAIDFAAMAKALALPATAARVLDLGAFHDLGRVREGVSHIRKVWS